MRMRRLGLAGVGVIALLAGCRGILGIHDELTIQCFATGDCPLGDICDPNGECVPAPEADSGSDAFSVENGSETGDARLQDADAASPTADAVPSGPADSSTDRSASDAPVTDGAADAGPADANGETSAPDGKATDAADASATKAPADASDGSTESSDDASDACSVSPSGTCAACSGACTIQRPGWAAPPAAGGAAIISAHTFAAVQITVPNPSWLLQLGVESVNTGVTGQLALYEDSGGQPGSLITSVTLTIKSDPQNDGTEQSVACGALCLRLTHGTYWIGAVFDSTIFVRSDDGSGATVYQANSGSYPDGGTLNDGVVPPGTVSTGLTDRNVYIVVTEQ